MISRAKFGMLGTGTADTVRVANRATIRLARPGVASKLTSRTGTPALRAAATTGGVTNPPSDTTQLGRHLRINAAASLRPRRRPTRKRINRRGSIEKGSARIAENSASDSLSIDASIGRAEHAKIVRAVGSRARIRSAMASPGEICPPVPPPASMITGASDPDAFVSSLILEFAVILSPLP